MHKQSSFRSRIRRLLTVGATSSALAVAAACGGSADAPDGDVDAPAAESEEVQDEPAEEPAEEPDAGDTLTAELPNNFPDDVPLPDLPLSHVTEMPEELKTWDLFFAVTDQESDFADYVDVLEDADFTHAAEADEGEEVTGAMMQPGSYLVTLSQTDDPDFNPSLRLILKDSDE